MDQNDMGFICFECDGVIPDGVPMWSINLHREVYGDGVITVLEADCVFVFCEKCAKLKDFTKIHVPNKMTH